MKNAILLLTWILLLALPLNAQDEKPSPKAQATPQLMESKTGTEIKVEQLVTELKHYEVILLGEQHDNDSGHEFQLDVIRGLVGQGLNVVVSMEQFERDVQGVMDDYLANRITEDQFLDASRPWKNYPEHYRPIVEFAKEKQLPIIAGNVPRRLAANIAEGKPTKDVDRVFLPRSTSAPENAYWQNFLETMQGHGGTGAADSMKKFYESQCLKDDAMAEAITDYIAKNPHQPKTIVHLCGHFHSDYGLGTAARVVHREPLVRIAVVTMESTPEDGKRKSEEVRPRGHYVFWTIQNKKAGTESTDDK